MTPSVSIPRRPVRPLWKPFAKRFEHKPSELSGGEQQRVAIARALVFEPKFIFADEPTGNLDQKNAHEIANILFDCCQENGSALVLVTHSNELAAKAEYIYTLANGHLTHNNEVLREAVSC